MIPNVEDDISKLNLSTKLINSLKGKNINSIKDVWVLKRKNLKDLGLNDKEIKNIIISLQLIGLDLNKKRYD